MSLITNDAIMQHFGYPGAVNDKVRAFFNALYTGSGSPEGVITADTGAFYLDTTNGALYAKQSGSGNTGWIAGIAPGSGSGPYAPTTDARLSDTRTPTDASVTLAKLAADAAAALAAVTVDWLTTGEATIGNRDAMPNAVNVNIATQQLRLGYFTARKTEVCTQVRIICGATAVSGTAPTLIQVGVWSEDAITKDLTLVAYTDNDLTLLAVGSTAYTKALHANFTKTASVRYAMGVLVVSTGTMPQLAGTNASGAIASEAAQLPRTAAVIPSQTTLPPTILSANLSATPAKPYIVVLP